MRPIAGCVLVLCASTMVANPQADKQPWQWSDEERLTARFDPRAMIERNEAYARSQVRAASSERRAARPAMNYVIDGRRNPELLMRHELLEHLVRGIGSNKADAEKYRRALAPSLGEVGLNAGTFWAELEAATSPYLSLRERFAARGRGYGRAEEKALCAARADALSAAEKHFGPEKFDKLLYVGVAPYIIYTQSTTYPDATGRLRREARGCQ